MVGSEFRMFDQGIRPEPVPGTTAQDIQQLLPSIVFSFSDARVLRVASSSYSNEQASIDTSASVQSNLRILHMFRYRTFSARMRSRFSRVMEL